MTKNFPKVLTESNSQIWKAQKTPMQVFTQKGICDDPLVGRKFRTCIDIYFFTYIFLEKISFTTIKCIAQLGCPHFTFRSVQRPQ